MNFENKKLQVHPKVIIPLPARMQLVLGLMHHLDVRYACNGRDPRPRKRPCCSCYSLRVRSHSSLQHVNERDSPLARVAVEKYKAGVRKTPSQKSVHIRREERHVREGLIRAQHSIRNGLIHVLDSAMQQIASFIK